MQAYTNMYAYISYIYLFSINTEYGLGYAWKPDEITITVGDTIFWKWYGTSFTRQLSVQQIDQPGDTEYNGDGFISSSSTSGSFSQVFTETGDYYYIAGGYGHIGEIYVHATCMYSHI